MDGFQNLSYIKNINQTIWVRFKSTSDTYKVPAVLISLVVKHEQQL
jgi:hypothetical protein